ncbi:MAG: 4Fe-4S binding protein [Candidatus Bathyarchaeota archaeon]|nr:MAG: 4Fe-4S binding protein [Candidatus Bathyarchaeota archaeon]
MTHKPKRWQEIPIAGVCWKPATEYHTGDWRTFKPDYTPEKCKKCLLCSMICPDAAITWNETNEQVEFNYDFCKGCGICANECPGMAIHMIREGGE